MGGRPPARWNGGLKARDNIAQASPWVRRSQKTRVVGGLRRSRRLMRGKQASLGTPNQAPNNPSTASITAAGATKEGDVLPSKTTPRVV